MSLELNEISKNFKDDKVLDRVSLYVPEGKTLVLFGPSGAGKTVLLRLISGVIGPDEGHIKISGMDVDGVEPEDRNIGMAFHRAKPELRGGYYLEISADDSFIAVGFWNPNKEDLLRIRKEIEIDGQEFKSIINQKKIKDIWGDIKGEEVKTSPKGFDRDHEHIDMIKKKQFIFVKKLNEEDILDENFHKELVAFFLSIRPFFDYMSEILTTNLDGESII